MISTRLRTRFAPNPPLNHDFKRCRTTRARETAPERGHAAPDNRTPRSDAPATAAASPGAPDCRERGGRTPDVRRPTIERRGGATEGTAAGSPGARDGERQARGSVLRYATRVGASRSGAWGSRARRRPHGADKPSRSARCRSSARSTSGTRSRTAAAPGPGCSSAP